MSLHPQPIPEIPVETARIAHAAFPKGNVYMKLRDEVKVLYEDADFAPLFSKVGQPAETPWRLTLISIMQFMENLTDRQAANAVRGRIDWKYTLGLELGDPGFDFSVLSEFRARLVEGEREALILERLLERFKERGWLKAGGRQRTDATHVLAAIHGLNRLELVGRTLQALLEELAKREPAWLKAQITPDWFDRYGRLVDEYRLPKKESERQALAEQIGRDGQHLLVRLAAPEAPSELGELEIVETLRQVWAQQYDQVEGQLRWRNRDDLPPSGERIASPHDPEARYSLKRQTTWVGYKVHLTETCDEDLPHLITQVETRVGTEQDIQALEAIQQDLAQVGLLPAEQLVDMGYGSGETIHTSQNEYGVELICPVHQDTSWQAKTPGAFDQTCFEIDWQAQQATCPAGHPSRTWITTKTLHDQPAIFVRFSPTHCTPCPVREHCTHSQSGGRELTLIPQDAYLALQKARQRQQEPKFSKQYAQRAGIEGTLSQAVGTLGVRQARYVGLAKTHLQHLLVAVALNWIRIIAWLEEIPRAKTRVSHFAALAA
jgi:transposase